MTSDHLFPMLENEGDSQRLVEVASALAMARVPEEIIEAIRLGCLTALSKPDRGVRVIVVGDILRRMVARTLAKQISKKVEEATAPFEYTLSTKAGCECVAHILQSLTDLSPEVTFTSIDGGAYDLISRNAMLEGLFRMSGVDALRRTTLDMRESVACAEAAHSSSVRRRRRSADEEAIRATRALSLEQMGELSAAQQALEGASLAPGNLATLGMLTDRLEDHQCQEVL